MSNKVKALFPIESKVQVFSLGEGTIVGYDEGIDDGEQIVDLEVEVQGTVHTLLPKWLHPSYVTNAEQNKAFEFKVNSEDLDRLIGSWADKFELSNYGEQGLTPGYHANGNFSEQAPVERYYGKTCGEVILEVAKARRDAGFEINLEYLTAIQLKFDNPNAQRVCPKTGTGYSMKNEYKLRNISRARGLTILYALGTGKVRRSVSAELKEFEAKFPSAFSANSIQEHLS